MRKYLLLMIIGVFAISCSKDDKSMTFDDVIGTYTIAHPELGEQSFILGYDLELIESYYVGSCAFDGVTYSVTITDATENSLNSRGIK